MIINVFIGILCFIAASIVIIYLIGKNDEDKSIRNKFENYELLEANRKINDLERKIDYLLEKTATKHEININNAKLQKLIPTECERVVKEMLGD